MQKQKNEFNNALKIKNIEFVQCCNKHASLKEKISY